MAAIICKGFSDFCNGCTKVICAPLTLCCDSVTSLCSNPFCLYVAVTVGLNISPIALGITPIVQSPLGCKGSTWLLVDVILCALNIWAAFYVAIKYRTRTNDGSPQSSGFNRARDILCYDPAVAIYILVLMGFFIWLCVGASWTGSLLEGSGDCSDGVPGIVSQCIGLGFAFFGVGFCALCISLCCSCCMNDSSGNDNTMYQMPPGTASNQQGHQMPASQFSKPNGTGPSSSEYAANNDVESNAFPVQSEPIYVTATVVDHPEPSAPPAAGAGNNMNTSLDDEAKAAASGVKLGGKLGNVLNADDKTKAKLENVGAKASVAANKGIKAMKKMAGLSSSK